jgi:hypothetical protein
MATVTGFTAERMLVIENETVVDGEVRGDNLFLMTREGVEIDAGNVRGPKGDTGATGAPGAGNVLSVNDQTGAVYSPRIFATSAALNSGWASPPEGASALTIDSDAAWYKSQSGWDLSNPVRVFNTAAERDSHWPSPPRGAMCVTLDTQTNWVRTTNGWQPPPGTLVYTGYMAIPNLATGAIWPGWAADVYGFVQSLTYPFPTRAQALVSYSAGYGGDWTSWYSYLSPYNGAPGSPYVYDSSGQAVWASSSLIHGWDVAPNQSVGFKHTHVAQGMGGNSTNLHTGGEATIQVFSRV